MLFDLHQTLRRYLSVEEVKIEMDSILGSIKKLLGIQPEYTAFDEDLIIHINSVFVILNQLNIGPSDGFFIMDSDTTWEDYMTDINQALVRSYVYLKVRLLFDPPGSGVLVENINRMISELEWRLYLEGDTSEGGDDNE